MPNARVLAVVNRKGGVGKTTTAVNLACGLARKLEGKGHVLLIDLDPQGNIVPSLGLHPNGADIARLLLGEITLEKSMVLADRSKESSGPAPARPNLFVIPATGRLAAAKVRLISMETSSRMAAQFEPAGESVAIESVDEVLERRLDKAKRAFNYIILDCPPSLDILNNAVYRFADEAIVPVKVDFLGLAGTAMHTNDIIGAQTAGINIKIGLIVPTFVRAREKLAKQMLGELVAQYGKSRVAPPIPQAAVVEQAPAARGLALLEYAPDSPAGQAYQKVVDRVYNG